MEWSTTENSAPFFPTPNKVQQWAFCIHGFYICGFNQPWIENRKGNSLVVQWLGLRASTAGGTGSIPGWGNKILQAAWCSQKKKKSGKKDAKKQYLNLPHTGNYLRIIYIVLGIINNVEMI